MGPDTSIINQEDAPKAFLQEAFSQSMLLVLNYASLCQIGKEASEPEQLILWACNLFTRLPLPYNNLKVYSNLKIYAQGERNAALL